ncbi:hypothetical protein LXT21_21605 [Myxococcus sp. K38C18041901]|uniref:hypothetical protein n=1 Tax=Myxococcus guangdongensis TaxID=2906760 RepID=UPI0020A71350|nr:hypothetical protein [Myxococcus guangdongensis]MCP3061382.1 hypothetical protein [Myxococcus guangdongensis]
MGDDAGTQPDAGAVPDSGAEPDAGAVPDAGTEPDAGIEPDAGTTPDAGVTPDPFTICEGACRETSTTIRMGDNSRVLTNAYFGYTEPESPDGAWTVWIELNNGTPGECPSPDSSVPAQLVNVYDVKVPVDATPQSGTTIEGEPRTTLVDFDGSLSVNWFDHSTSMTFTPVAASLCATCAKTGEFPASHFVAFDVEAVMEDGAFTGHGYATYCPALTDLVEE